ncbi:MAG: hypothetical protein ABFD75_01265 [Smithella sp.]
MLNNFYKDNIIDRVQWTLVVLASIIIDAILLSAWIGAQYIVETYVITPLTLKDIDSLTLLIFKYIFAIATLAPVTVYVISDIIVIIKQAILKIKEFTGE